MTDPPGRAAVSSLVTAGAVLLAAGCASAASPSSMRPSPAVSTAELSAEYMTIAPPANRQLDAANQPVEDAVRVIRDQLGLPPPDTS